MLTITIPATELWDENKNEFIDLLKKPITLQLEHSLVSLAKWEAKWKKPFLGKQEEYNMTVEETTDYIRCMTITQNVNPEIYNYLPSDIFSQINNYIKDAMTATWFGENNSKKKPAKEIITAELIYYQMIVLNIPIEFQKWHLNRLLTLIKVCAIKQEEQPTGVDKKGKPKMSKEQIKNRRAINQARLKAMGTEG